MYEAAFVPEPMIERHARHLAAFAERCVRLTEDLADRALAAEDNAQAADLAQAFHAVGRSLRQAIALEQRLGREAHKARRQAQEEERIDRDARREDRKFKASHALHSLIWTEYEPIENLHPVELVSELVAEEAKDPAFTEDPVEQVIARMQANLRVILDKCVLYQANGWNDEDADEDAAEESFSSPSAAGVAQTPPADSS